MILLNISVNFLEFHWNWSLMKTQEGLRDNRQLKAWQLLDKVNSRYMEYFTRETQQSSNGRLCFRCYLRRPLRYKRVKRDQVRKIRTFLEERGREKKRESSPKVSILPIASEYARGCTTRTTPAWDFLLLPPVSSFTRKATGCREREVLATDNQKR